MLLIKAIFSILASVGIIAFGIAVFTFSAYILAVVAVALLIYALATKDTEE